MEVRLNRLGYQPTVQDSPERWAVERARASRLADRALILVGASRFQLGLDLDVLRRETGMEPVQLAIDGSAASAPILAGLAADPTIRGTILVDYYDDSIGVPGKIATQYQDYYDAQKNATMTLQPNAWVEKRLAQMLHENILSYTDGASPFNSLMTRIISTTSARRVLTTLPDRSRLADYSAVNDLQRYYHDRVARTLGMQLDTSHPDTGAMLAEKIATLSVSDTDKFQKGTQAIKSMVDSIQSRGGRVLFVAMPSSGLIRAIEERRFPRSLYWDKFLEIVDVPGIRTNDTPAMKDFSCPDGSHLDHRDRSEFTRKLIRALRLGSIRQTSLKD